MEYWQQILDRAEATIPVWQQYFPTLALGATNLAAFTTLKDSLPTLAQTRDNNVQTVDNARQAKEFAWLSLRLISLKIPAICEGVLDPDSGLLDDLGKIYAIVPWSPDKTLARCKLLGPFWAAANSWQAAQIPSRPPIVRNTVSQSIFMSSIATYYPLSQADSKNSSTS